ncbi:phage head morphogenesis protein [Faecalibacterium prausnitzii]|jgi:SPP1 gp7 family putative phage head morphogenesis protein|uniref:minor capsid protein n=1 Tax=Faecalibacterium prausnitzii TaxID=853 RepID=UPI001C02BA27|nr:minor capsid protein [Faecalibacterium prausnitzii]MBT9711576.1 phage head morphogenesis protein [Faecalibacterium prausnitzii]
MTNAEYWKQRFTQLEAAQNRKGAGAYLEIEKQYKAAQNELEAQIARWYQRFADSNGISLAQAKQWLKGQDLAEFKWGVKEYIKYGKENAINGAWMQELENASSKFHISRLEALQIQTQNSLETMFAQQMGTMKKALSDVYASGYYHTAYAVQQGFGLGWDIAGLDQAQIEKVLSKPWAVDGYNFSTRIWNSKTKLIGEVHNELSKNLLTGADPQKAIDSLAKKMGTSKSNAGRLVMTEQAYFSSAAQKDCFNDLDVEEYEIVATLDSHTSDICRSLDGKVFKMSDYKPGVTAPPFHVYCRSTTAPHFKENFDAGERAARGADGKTYYVPDDVTYSEWKKAFVDGDKSGFAEVQKNHFSRTEKRGTIKPKEQSEAAKFIEQACTTENVEHRAVQALPKQLTSDEIIERLAGGDMTQGSCSSLAFAYIGNKNGLDVLDFRDGGSRRVFSMNKNIMKMLELPGVEGSITKVKKEVQGTIDVLKNLELNKEYYLATGKHAAIVRKLDTGYQYLELQSKYQNGWMPFERYGSMATTLNKRFGCRKTVDKSFGYVWERTVILMDVDSFKDNEEFEQLLGYINTAVDKQRKGALGDVR